jgi:hypothetical protein
LFASAAIALRCTSRFPLALVVVVVIIVIVIIIIIIITIVVVYVWGYRDRDGSSSTITTTSKVSNIRSLSSPPLHSFSFILLPFLGGGGWVAG